MNKNDEMAQYPVGSVFTVTAERWVRDDGHRTQQHTVMLTSEHGAQFRLDDGDFYGPEMTSLFEVTDYQPVFVPWKSGARVIIETERYHGPLYTGPADVVREHGTVEMGTFAQRRLSPDSTYVRIDGRDRTIWLHPEGYPGKRLKPEPPTPAALIVEVYGEDAEARA